MFSKLYRLGQVVWQHGGVLKVWPIATGIASFSGKINEWTGFSLSSLTPAWFPRPAWWWGLLVLAMWVIFSLASRVIRYETPGLALEVVRDRRDGSWWLEVRNVGASALENVAVDFEKIENAAGERVFPHSFGLSREGGLSNPFPLRATQPKQGRFAHLVDGKIMIFGTSVNHQPTQIVLELDKYFVTAGAYSEADGAQCKRVLMLVRSNDTLEIS
jgi:hypothetical protein